MTSQKRAKQLRRQAEAETKGQPNVAYIGRRRHRESRVTVVLAPHCTRAVYKALKRSA